MPARRRLTATAVVVGLTLTACSTGSETVLEPAPVDPTATTATTQPVLAGTEPVPEGARTAPSGVDAPDADTGSSDGAGSSDATRASVTEPTIVPEITAPELVPEPVSDSFLVERVVVPTGSGGVIDVHRPIDGEDWPLVVLYGDLDEPAAVYAPLATALAESGAVVAVSAYDTEQPPVSSACARSAATVWADESRADPGRLTLVGVGAGGVAAIGEGLGGAWTSWSTASCAAGAPPIEPSAIVTIDGEFGLYDDADPTSEGLRAVDQVTGGNPYVRLGVVQGVPLDDAAVELLGRLDDEGYDATLDELGVPAAELLSDPEPLVAAIRSWMEAPTAT
ncbi:MAG: hypothetical protein AAGA17_19920 [Actinomycetota bacterium]